MENFWKLDLPVLQTTTPLDVQPLGDRGPQKQSQNALLGICSQMLKLATQMCHSASENKAWIHPIMYDLNIPMFLLSTFMKFKKFTQTASQIYPVEQKRRGKVP